MLLSNTRGQECTDASDMVCTHPIASCQAIALIRAFKSWSFVAPTMHETKLMQLCPSIWMSTSKGHQAVNMPPSILVESLVLSISSWFKLKSDRCCVWPQHRPGLRLKEGASCTCGASGPMMPDAFGAGFAPGYATGAHWSKHHANKWLCDINQHGQGHPEDDHSQAHMIC